MTDDHPLMEDDRDLDSGGRDPIRYRTTVSCEGCGVHIETGEQYCDDCSPPIVSGESGSDGGLGAELRPVDGADEAGDDDE